MVCVLFKQKTAYDMRISDWSSDVCSSDLWQMTLIMVSTVCILPILLVLTVREPPRPVFVATDTVKSPTPPFREAVRFLLDRRGFYGFLYLGFGLHVIAVFAVPAWAPTWLVRQYGLRSEEHTSELQSLMRISYAVFCLKKKN